MLHIAVCDDDAHVRELLAKYLDRYKTEHHLDIQTTFFPDGVQLLKADLTDIDLLISDIQMPHMTGIEAARVIRRSNQHLPIIFLTNYIQYALEGYEVQAFRFLLKPIEYEPFSDVVGKVLLQTNHAKQSFLTLKKNDEIIRLPIKDLIFVETDRGNLLFHHRSGVIACRTSLQKIEEQLSDHQFFRCHKAYLVALREIRSVDVAEIKLINGQTLPVSKHRKKELKETLTVFWGEMLP